MPVSTTLTLIALLSFNNTVFDTMGISAFWAT